MKKVILFLLLIMTKLTAFSQTDTDTTYVRCLPEPMLRMILNDLVSGDSAKSMLTLAEYEIDLLKDKISIQDSIILNYKIKEENYNRIISENRTFEILENHIKILDEQIKVQKRKNNIRTVSSLGLIGTLTYLLLRK